VAIYIKDNPTDTGSSPTCGQTYWMSDSIRLADTAGNTVGSAVVGTPMRIYVRIDSNEGTYQPSSSTPLLLEVWVCNPSFGVGPDAAIGAAAVGGTMSAGGPNGLKLTLPSLDPAQPSGAISPPGPGPEYFVPWTPQPGDLLGAATQKHLCVGANCVWSPGLPSAEGVAMAGSGLLDVCNNRRHAQRNIELSAVSGGGFGMSMPFQVVAPEEGDEEELELELVEQPREWRLTVSEQAQLIGDGVARLAEGDAPYGDLYELLERGAKLVLAGKNSAPIRPTAGGDFRATLSGEEGAGHRLVLKLRPGEATIVKAEIMMAESDEPGMIRAFDVVGRSNRRREIGGLRILGIVAPEAELTESAR
jgi:hypothetical protein